MSRRGFSDSIGDKIARRLRGRREAGSHWYWVGMFGLVGWSVMIPTVIGVALGALADETRHDTVSWTLTGLVVGLAIGCATAWYWVRRESRREP